METPGSDVALAGLGAGLGYAAATNPDVAKSVTQLGETVVKTEAKMAPWIFLMFLLFLGFVVIMMTKGPGSQGDSSFVRPVG